MFMPADKKKKKTKETWECTFKANVDLPSKTVLGITCDTRLLGMAKSDASWYNYLCMSTSMIYWKMILAWCLQQT